LIYYPLMEYKIIMVEWRKALLIFLAVAGALWMMGCKGGSVGAKIPDVPKPVSAQIAPTSGVGVEVEATASGGSVYIKVRNNTPAPLRVSPFYVALIIDGQYPEIRFNPATAKSEFPVTSLPSGAEATGFIHFRNYENLKGQQLVFNSPDYKPLLIPIKPAE
jgi:hypothetical protein